MSVFRKTGHCYDNKKPSEVAAGLIGVLLIIKRQRPDVIKAAYYEIK